MSKPKLGFGHVSDALQQTYLDVAKRAPEYLEKPDMSLFLWLRWLTGERLLAMHRRLFGTQKRDVAKGIAIHRGAIPPTLRPGHLTGTAISQGNSRVLRWRQESRATGFRHFRESCLQPRAR